MSRYLSIAAVLVWFAGLDAYADLRVDINDRTSDTEVHTQPSFVGVTQDGITGVATDIGTIDISFANVPPSGNIDDRNRGSTSVSSTQPLSRLLRDLLFTQTALPDRGTLDVTVSGLDAGDYLLTAYFHDAAVDHVSGDLEISTDGGSTFGPELQDILFGSGSDPSPVGRGSLAFSASGSDVVFRVIGDGGTSGFTSETALISGFVIEPFTEFGDFDGLGGITTDDFFILSGNLGTHLEGNFVGHAGGDIDVDGDVDLDDFGMFKAMFPAIVAAATAVPEPSTAVLAAAASVALLAVRRRIARR